MVSAAGPKLGASSIRALCLASLSTAYHEEANQTLLAEDKEDTFSGQQRTQQGPP